VAKVRVYELAKELGLESKELLAKLQEVGEFVRSASSTVEAPVVRKLMDKFPDLVPAEAAPKTKKAPAKKAAPKQTVKVEDLPPELQQMIEDATPTTPPTRAATPAQPPRATNNPFSTTPSTPSALPRPPRAGNNPFSSGGGPRPPARPIRPGEAGRGGEKLKPGQRPPMSGARPGSVRPGFAARPTQNNPRPTSGGSSSRPSTSSSPYRSPSSAPSTGSPFGGKGGGRPPQRGGAAGAFGKGGKGKSKNRGQKSKKERREDFENLPAPQLGGAVVPRGDGKTVVRMRRGATLMDFAEKIKADPAALVSALFHLGEMVTATQSVDEDTFTLLGAELGFVIQIVSPEDEDRELLEEFDINLEIHHEHDGNDRAITFIDTPGHEAFTAMRARGAKVTDIAVLVVAADDGVMPQTIEALNHAQAADVPIVVAVNKIDKEGANPDKIRQQLTEYNLIAEEYGGQTMFVNVSALSGKGINELIDAILLTADAAIDLRAVADGIARGVAIEANLDKGRGPVATVLVQRGTLNVGDAIVAGGAYGRVRAMLDEHGETVDVAGPSRPVQVLGFTSVPSAGDSFIVAEDDRTARQIAEKRQLASRNASLAKARKKVSLEDFLEQSKVSTLNLILKGDVSGSVEALEDALVQLDVGTEVDLRVIHRGVGAITKNDVTLASASTAVIIGFNVKPEPQTAIFAEHEGVEVKFYTVIYKAIEEIEASLKGLLKPEYEEAVLGNAEVRDIFKSSKFGNIAGCMVSDGNIRRNAKVRTMRAGVVIGENLSIESLRRFKDDATEVREGFECGIGLGSFKDLQVGDVIQAYEIREKKRA